MEAKLTWAQWGKTKETNITNPQPLAPGGDNDHENYLPPLYEQAIGQIPAENVPEDAVLVDYDDTRDHIQNGAGPSQLSES